MRAVEADLEACISLFPPHGLETFVEIIAENITNVLALSLAECVMDLIMLDRTLNTFLCNLIHLSVQ